MRAARSFVLALAFAAFACGGDDDGGAADATPGPDAEIPGLDAPPPGPPLLVVGTITVENGANNEIGSNKRVQCDVIVTRDGAPVSNAIIKINPPGSIQTFLIGDALEPSHYSGNYMGYNNDSARMEITAGTDHIAETVLIGQSMFRIDAPTAASMQTELVALPVQWGTNGSAADVLRIETAGGHDSGELTDADNYTIPGASITLTTPDDTVTVTRSQRNTLPGTAAGTQIDFGVASSVDFTVIAN